MQLCTLLIVFVVVFVSNIVSEFMVWFLFFIASQSFHDVLNPRRCLFEYRPFSGLFLFSISCFDHVRLKAPVVCLNAALFQVCSCLQYSDSIMFFLTPVMC
jgi:hypothetical protein